MLTRSLVGAIGGDAVSLTGGTATFSDKTVANGKTVTLTGATLSGADAGNYVLDSVATTTANITAKHITGSFTADNKEYDGNNSATVLTRSLSGTIGGDAVSLTGGTATFSDKTVANGKTVTLTGASLSGADAGNYVLDSVATTTANITAKHITGSFTADNKEYDGNNSATVLTRSLVGAIGGDAVSLTGGTATFSDKTVANGKTVTLTGATLSGADAGNYVLDSVATTTANITAKHITGSFTADNKEYDGNNSATVLTRSLSGTIGGDAVSLTGGTATFSDKTVANGKTVTLTGASLSGADAGNYVLDSVATTIANITAKHITGNFTADNKEYDGNNSATVLTRSLNGTIMGDVVSLTEGTATFADKNVGMGKTVTLTGATLSGADAGNYVLDSVGTTTANITALHITGAFTADNKVYDGNNSATVLTRSLVGAIGGDAVSLTGGTAAFSDKNVANGKTVTLTGASLSGADAGNYILDSVGTTTANITARPATVTADDKAKTYGDANPALTATVTGTVSGDVLDYTLATTAAQFSNVGNYPITVTLGSNPNYDVTPANGTLAISARPATVTADDKAKTYGDANPALTATVTGTVNGDVLDYTLATTAVQFSNVGNYPITVTLGSNPNYDVTPADGTLAISARPATVTADDKAKTYGDANPALTATVTGTVNGDTLNYSLSTTAAQFSSVGDYAITVTLGSNPNYNVTPTNGTLHISPKAASVSADNKTKTYGDPNPALTATVTGTVNGDMLNYTLGTTAVQFSNVGTYPITVTLGSNPNYTVTPTNGTLTINQRPATVTADNKSKTYGEANPTFTATVVGQVTGGDTINYSLSTTAVQCSGAGTYAITVTLGSNPNYTVTPTNGTLTINKAHLTVKADNKSKAYNGTPFTAFTVTITGFVCGDTAAVVSGSATYTGSAVGATLPGTYIITPNVGTLSATNYDFPGPSPGTYFLNGTLTIGFGTCTGSDPGAVILPPINADGSSVYKRKAGSTIPVKFKVCDASGNSISDPNVVFPTGCCGSVTLTSIRRGTVDNVNENGVSDIPGSAFSFTGDKWQLNMSTTNLQAGDTDTFQIALKDGSYVTFTVGLK